MKRPSYRWGYLIAGVGGSRASFTGDACCAGGKMIFTPEESREIAEGMFGWKFFPAKRALVVGEYGEESQETPAYWKSARRSFLGLPDFSQPEWTGPMLDGSKKVCSKDAWLDISVRNFRVGAYRERPYPDCQLFGSECLNRNLFDAWKWLRERKEASNVRPE